MENQQSLTRKKPKPGLPIERLNQIIAQSCASIMRMSTNTEFLRRCNDILQIDNIASAERAIEQLLRNADAYNEAQRNLPAAKRARRN